MSYVIRVPVGDAAPPPDPTGQALKILATCVVPTLPIAAGVAAGFYLKPKSGAVAPIVGGLVGGLISVLALRSKVLSGAPFGA